jgi:predicted TIM-barrel fold metal-dependent hydrolase
MPFLTERFTRLPLASKDLESRVPRGVQYELTRFYYDVAQSAHPMTLASLLRLVPVSQVLFGTDFPFRSSLDHVNGLIGYGFGAADLRAIERDNAVRLPPRLQT